MTKQTVRVTKSKDPKVARVSLAFEFVVDDPRAEAIFNAIGLCLKAALTDDEKVEFLARFEEERLKVVPR